MLCEEMELREDHPLLRLVRRENLRLAQLH
jgi:hypothetical protein